MEELVVQSQASDAMHGDAEEKYGFMASKPVCRDIVENFRLS